MGLALNKPKELDKHFPGRRRRRGGSGETPDWIDDLEAARIARSQGEELEGSQATEYAPGEQEDWQAQLAARNAAKPPGGL